MCSNSININSIIANGIFGLVGLIAGALLARFNGISFIKRQEFNKAASAFHIAFIDVIYLLRQNIDSGTEMISKIITSDVLVSHEKAKIAFEFHVSKKDLPGFNTAWGNYQNSKYNAYGTQGVLDHREISSFCLNHLNELLKYAKPKR